ncbi:hypothetical protein HELRODRAFT_183488 [Helobdella robusta]|uniref:WSC domain-containing protein n=1 Tax=Helobdella robusta TaxID=6412 RepID=T1FJR2_HELRO|nr:hypothetical protein HELRODRAFT_183488 [Helobdella robusta]ESO11106.1 hypothetical protein HELRODRAFT_183488 [Helobdella robusta]
MIHYNTLQYTSLIIFVFVNILNTRVTSVSLEIQLENVALHKPVILSAYKNNSFLQIATDGIKDPNSILSCPKSDLDEWIMVDLLRIYLVSHVDVYPSPCPRCHGLDYFSVRLINQINLKTPVLKQWSNVLCGQQRSVADDVGFMRVYCDTTGNKMSGRFVVVQQFHARKSRFALSVSEVEVYGEETYAEWYDGCFLIFNVGAGTPELLVNSVRECKEHCQGHSHFSLMNGRTCRCGGIPELEVSSFHCNAICPDLVSFCGGARAFSVYTDKSTVTSMARGWTYYGCFLYNDKVTAVMGIQRKPPLSSLLKLLEEEMSSTSSSSSLTSSNVSPLIKCMVYCEKLTVFAIKVVLSLMSSCWWVRLIVVVCGQDADDYGAYNKMVVMVIKPLRGIVK